MRMPPSGERRLEREVPALARQDGRLASTAQLRNDPERVVGSTRVSRSTNVTMVTWGSFLPRTGSPPTGSSQ